MTDCPLPVRFEAMQDFSKTSQRESILPSSLALLLLTDLSHAMHRFSVYRNEWFRLSASLSLALFPLSLHVCLSARITGHVKKGATVNRSIGSEIQSVHAI